ncbi:MAG: metallophosphoesterase family protein [Gloeobacteraceae cyanobacterium ES-bin-144]|nr:metallophosphoesterase family protein [Verrucomicrobiales bacterium]
MKQPIRILSDLHLGHKVSRIEQVPALRGLIAGAGTVIFNGDTWQELARPFRERSTVMLEELHKLCEEEGVETVFLSGNHDPGWPGPGWVEIADGRIVITHGDALYYSGSPWKRETLTAGERLAELWRRHPAAGSSADERLRLTREIARELSSVEYPTGRHFIQRAWDAVMPPKRALKMIEAWLTQGTVGARFCERYFPKAEILLIGHFHHQGCWVRNGRLVINTGSFCSPGRAHWAEWNDGWLTRGVIDESPTECRIGRTLNVWRLQI